MVQQIIAYVILLAGLVYAAIILKTSYDNWSEVKASPGKFSVLFPSEFILFLLASLSVPDYVMQTILGKQLRIVEDRELPGTVVGCGVVPGSILAFLLLIKGNPADTMTLIICSIGVMIGSFIGSELIGKLDGQKIKTLMQIALILSLIFLVIKMIVSKGRISSDVALSGWKLYTVAFLCLLSGIINMFGVPMKPTRTAIFLIAGLSPLATLTLVVVLGSLAPISGGIEVIRRGIYQKKMVFSATTLGTLGGIIGALFVVSISEMFLNVLLIAVMLIAILIMFRD